MGFIGKYPSNGSLHCPGILQSQKGSLKVFYPGSKAQIWNLRFAPAWEDESCYPSCPACYEGICETLGQLLLIIMAALLILQMIFSPIVYCLSAEMHMYAAVTSVSTTLYSMLEMTGAVFALIAIWAVRRSADDTSTLHKVLVTSFVGIDGMGGALRALSDLWMLCLQRNLLTNKVYLYMDLFLTLVNSVSISLLMLQMTMTEHTTAETLPIMLEVLVSLVKVFLTVLSQTFEDFFDELEDTTIEYVSRISLVSTIVDEWE